MSARIRSGRKKSGKKREIQFCDDEPVAQKGSAEMTERGAAEVGTEDKLVLKGGEWNMVLRPSGLGTRVMTPPNHCLVLVGAITRKPDRRHKRDFNFLNDFAFKGRWEACLRQRHVSARSTA